MKINGYEYSKEEVLEALKKKGYKIVMATFHNEEHIHGSRFIKHHYSTECAIKGNEIPNEENQWENVAKKNFVIPIVKPPLV